MFGRIKDVFRGLPARAAGLADRLRGWFAERERAAGLLRYGALLLLVAMLGSASVAARRRLVGKTPAEDRQASAAARPPVAAATPVPSPTPEPRRWVWPVEGAILWGFSPEAAVWSDTLGQWQTHPALDIAASPGEAVCACADGFVADSWKDRLWGNVIVLDHGDGWRSTYAGLGTLQLAEVGSAVAAGAEISCAGTSADCEAAMDCHLHFALEKDGIPVDFAALAGN